MAETSGFFAAMVDGNTGAYDRKYIAKQFANYFSLFIGNGVFGNPTNQLMVKPGNGLSIIVSEGRAFIDGYWYYNDSDKVIPLVTNYESVARTDSVRLRMSEDTRDIKVDVFTGDTELVRGEDTYDLQLATVQVMPMSETVTAAQIHDTRPDQSVCGFVTGLMKVQTTADLFAQYQAMFEEWFETMKNQLSEDAAGNLQVQIDDLKTVIGNEVQFLTRDIVGQIVWADSFHDAGCVPPSIKENEIPLFALKASITSNWEEEINKAMFGIEFLYFTYSQRDYVESSDTESEYNKVAVDNNIPVEIKTTGLLRGYNVFYANNSFFSLESKVGYTQTNTGTGNTKLVGGFYSRSLFVRDSSINSDVALSYNMEKFPRSMKDNVEFNEYQSLGTRPCLPCAAILYGVKRKIKNSEVLRKWHGGKAVSEQISLDSLWDAR